MAYNNKAVLKDLQGNTIPQYYNPVTDSYEPLEGSDGANKVVIFDTNGSEIVSTQVVQPIIDKLDQLTGTALAEENRKVFEAYNPSKQYYLGNKVAYEGSSYYVIVEPPVGTLPTNPSYFLLIAEKGDKGIQGEQGIQGIQGVKGDKGDNLEFTWNGTELGVRVEGDVSYSYVDLKGDTGATGLTGNDGRGIVSVVRTSGSGSAGTTDTYTITYTDATTSLFYVYNGADGLGSGDMLKNQYDTNNDGKVNSADNADTVNGLTVETAVPINAKFTDTVYEHPATHSPSIITQDTNNRFVTDAEKSTWNSKADGSHVHTGVYEPADATILKDADIGSTVQAYNANTVVDASYVHTDNNYTTTEKNKLAGIEAGAEVNVNADWNSSSGDSQILNKPTIPDTSGLMPKSGGVLENYREKLTTLSGTSTTINLSLGNVFTHSLTGNTTYTISNAVSGQAHSFTLIITQISTVRTLTFPASVKWQGGDIPDMSTASKTYVLTFLTVDGGTTWLGMFGGEF